MGKVKEIVVYFFFLILSFQIIWTLNFYNTEIITKVNNKKKYYLSNEEAKVVIKDYKKGSTYFYRETDITYRKGKLLIFKLKETKRETVKIYYNSK